MKYKLLLKSLLVLLCSGILHLVHAQQVAFDWVKTFGNTGVQTMMNRNGGTQTQRHVVVDDSGNVYSTVVLAGGDIHIGNTRYYADSGAYVLTKHDDAGNLIWSRQIGITPNKKFITGIAVDKEQNVIIGGWFYDTIYLNKYGEAPSITSGFDSDGFIAKYDREGDYVWSQHIRGLLGSDHVNTVMVDNEGSIYAAGYFYISATLVGTSFTVTSNTTTGYILKLNSSGNALWMKSFGEAWGFAEPIEICKGNNSDFYVVGRFGQFADFDLSPGVADTFILYATGTGNSRKNDAFIARYDADGNLHWARNMGGENPDEARSVAVDIEGNAYVGGYFQDTAYFGQEKMISTSYLDSTYYAGYGWWVLTRVKTDQFICKLDSSGNFLWNRQFRTTYAPSGTLNFLTAIAVHPTVSNGVYASWILGDTTDFDPGPGEHFVPANPGTPTHRPALLKLTSEGDFEWVKPFTGNQANMISLIVNKRGCVFSIGTFGESVDFDPDDGNVLINPKGTVDGFLHKMICIDTNSAAVSYTKPCTGLTLNGDTFMVSGTYTQTLTNHLGCDSILTIHLTIELPEAIINVNGFVLSTTNKFATYQWMLNGEQMEGQTDSLLTVSENGNYQVIVTDESGCVDTSEIYVVDNVSIASLPSLQEQVRVYPNPVSQMLRIYSPVPVNLYLTGLEGRVLLEKNNTTVLDLGSLSGGVYLLNIKDEKGRLIKTEKIVKQ